MWNIKKLVSKGGYVYALVPEHPKATKNGYVLEHRIVMENILNRPLLDNEDIHHIDGNGRNNNPNNLEIKKRGDHQRFHMHQRFPNGQAKIHLICANCGKEFDRNANQRPEVKKAKNAFCSRRCNGIYGKNHPTVTPLGSNEMKG